MPEQGWTRCPKCGKDKMPTFKEDDIADAAMCQNCRYIMERTIYVSGAGVAVQAKGK